MTLHIPSGVPDLAVWPRHMSIALGELGVTELPAARSNPRIIQYFQHTRLGGSSVDDSTPWCAAFANFCLEQAGIAGTRRANARSFLNWGESIQGPRFGAIAVLWRKSPESAAGHVGFVVAALPNRVVLLGGNQNNQVGYQEYGVGRVLSYRWPQASRPDTRSPKA